MHKHIFIAFALLLTFCPATPAERPAGTVLYFKSGDETYLLLADHAGTPMPRNVEGGVVYEALRDPNWHLGIEAT